MKPNLCINTFRRSVVLSGYVIPTITPYYNINIPSESHNGYDELPLGVYIVYKWHGLHSAS